MACAPAGARRAVVPLLLVLSVLLLAGCTTGVVVRGSGAVVERDISIGTFDAIEASNAFRVHYTPGAGPALTVRADDNLVDDVVAEVRGSTLVLRLDGVNTIGGVTLEADVSGPPVARLEASGASDMTIIEPLAGDRLEVVATGASRLDGTVDASRLDVEVSGASRVVLDGTADEVRANVSGASRLNLPDLQAGTVDANVSGASTADVTASGAITYDVSGASRLTYGGDGGLGTGRTSGASSVQSR